MSKKNMSNLEEKTSKDDSSLPSTSNNNPTILRPSPVIPVPPSLETSFQIPVNYPYNFQNYPNNSFQNFNHIHHGSFNPYHRRNPYEYNYRNNNIPSSVLPQSIITDMAEEKMRSTFKSIEMILETFNSLNMALDSTYSSIYGFFRTLTGVADHLIFIRNHLVELALIPRFAQIIKDFLKWILWLLGLKSSKIGQALSSSDEDAWTAALLESSDTFKNLNLEDRSSSLWPVFIFFSLVLGTPYIIWRLLGSNEIPKRNIPTWTLKNGRHFLAVALYDFKGQNPQELSFKKGQKLFVKPESMQPGSQWLMACSSENNSRVGMIPLNYVKLMVGK